MTTKPDIFCPRCGHELYLRVEVIYRWPMRLGYPMVLDEVERHSSVERVMCEYNKPHCGQCGWTPNADDRGET